MDGTETRMGTNVILGGGRRAFLNRVPPDEVKMLKDEKINVTFGGETEGGDIDVPVTDIREIVE